MRAFPKGFSGNITRDPLPAQNISQDSEHRNSFGISAASRHTSVFHCPKSPPHHHHHHHQVFPSPNSWDKAACWTSGDFCSPQLRTLHWNSSEDRQMCDTTSSADTGLVVSPLPRVACRVQLPMQVSRGFRWRWKGQEVGGKGFRTAPLKGHAQSKGLTHLPSTRRLSQMLQTAAPRGHHLPQAATWEWIHGARL